MSRRLSVIIPVLNEAAGLAHTLQDLQPLRPHHAELIVVDGGSNDDSARLAAPLADTVITSSRGRAAQMNAGAALSRGEILWFVHADTRIPPAALHRLLALPTTLVWGRFDVQLSGKQPMLRVVETMMNLRSRHTGIATGDQGIFVARRHFEQLGGFPAIPLMEDIALSRLLRRQSWPLCARERLVTASRRWERDGVWRTIGLMWRLRLAYFLGADPAALARRYYGR